MVQVTIDRWGDDLAVRLPADFTQSIELREGDRLQVEFANGNILLRRADPTADVTDLFEGETPERWRAIYANAYDWGPDVGREAVLE